MKRQGGAKSPFEIFYSNLKLKHTLPLRGMCVIVLTFFCIRQVNKKANCLKNINP